MTDTDRIIGFVRAIGIGIEERPIAGDSFLPGVAIECGRLVVDRKRLVSPGDVLHEAGHIAVTPPSERGRMSGALESGGGEEMAAIAWSYAAIVHLGIDPSVLFHEAGYKGDAATLIENFGAGDYFGVPLLQWYGMTRERAGEPGQAVYPEMTKWLRESEDGSDAFPATDR